MTPIKFINKQHCERPNPETVGITIEIMGLKSNPRIAIWVAEELEPDIRTNATLRSGIVAALEDFLDRMRKTS